MTPWFDAKHFRVIVYSERRRSRKKQKRRTTFAGGERKGLARRWRAVFSSALEYRLGYALLVDSTRPLEEWHKISLDLASVPFHRRFLSCHSSSGAKNSPYIDKRGWEERFLFKWILSFEKICKWSLIFFWWNIYFKKNIFKKKSYLFVDNSI